MAAGALPQRQLSTQGRTLPLRLLALAGGVQPSHTAALSPVAPTGVIAVDQMARIGLLGVGWQNYAQCLLAHALVGFGGYLSLGGLRLLRARPSPEQLERHEPCERNEQCQAVHPPQHGVGGSSVTPRHRCGEIRSPT